MGMTIDEQIRGLEYLKKCGIFPFSDTRTGIVITDEYVDEAIETMRKYQMIVPALAEYDLLNPIADVKTIEGEGMYIHLSDLQDYIQKVVEYIDNVPTVEAIPKDNVYKAIQEIMKYEHEGFINISLVRLDEILKKCGVTEDGTNEKTSD